MEFTNLRFSQMATPTYTGLFAGLPDLLPTNRDASPYAPPVPSTDPQQRAKEAEIEGMLGSQLRLTLTDGRVIVGIFYCYDSEGNVLMRECRRIDSAVSKGYGLICCRPEFISKLELHSAPDVLQEE
jgi:small nuclear ribonucleoprotein (snRNP)-like protein